MANQKYPHSGDQAGDQAGEFGIKHWTDSFPKDFHGWGPQTPIPDNELQQDSRASLGVDDDLTWQGGNDEDHIIWRYDGTRH